MAVIQYARIVGDWRRVVGDEIVSYENTEIGDVGIHGTVTLSPVWARGGPQGIVADPGAYYSIHPVVCRVRYGRLYDPTNTVPYEDVAVEIDGQPLVWKAKFELAFRRRAGEAEVPLQVREVTFDNAAMVAGEIALTGILPASAIPAEYQAYFTNAALSATVADEAKTTAVEAAGTATSAASTASSAAGVADAKAAAAAASVTLAAQEADRAVGLAGAQDVHIAGVVEDTGSATRTALNATYADKRARGANVARTTRRAQSGENLKAAVVGDSIADATTPGNTGGGPIEKFATIMEARFGIEVDVDNQARSGFTALRSHVNGHVNAAVHGRPDVLFICLGKNDIGSDIGGKYAPGYPRAASIASIERMCAAARTYADTADIVIIAEGPYMPGSSSNAVLRSWQNEARRVAATWGAEFIDVYEAFTALGDWSHLMYDSTHQNPAGNDLYAQVLAEHFPADFNGPTAPIATPARVGLSGIDKVRLASHAFGYGLNPTPGTSQSVEYITGGSGWSNETTTVVGDYIEVKAYATELHVQLSTAVADATVVDVSIDGVLIDADVNLPTQGKNGNYWISPATGLAPGEHTLRLTLKSGTLRTYAVSALLAPTAASAEIGYQAQLVSFGSSTTPVAMPTDGSFAVAVNSVAMPLPEGWSGATAEFIGTLRYRVTGATTTRRYIQGNLDISGHGGIWTPVDTFTADGEEQWMTKQVHAVVTLTATTVVALRARLLSTDKSLCQLAGYSLTCRLTRTA